MDTFPGARKSNFTNVMVREDGIYSKSYTGHMLGTGNGSSALVTVAVVAIVAAIAVPSLVKARRHAGRRHRPPVRIAPAEKMQPNKPEEPIF